MSEPLAASAGFAHQTQRRFEQLFTSYQDRLRLTGSIFLETDVEDVALGIGQHEIAFLDTGRERFRESLSDHALWSGFWIGVLAFPVFNI
jgi:hypothetical protein